MRQTRQHGVLVYSIKKNGERYAKPTFYKFSGYERTAEEVIGRLEKLNPGHKFEAADMYKEVIRFTTERGHELVINGDEVSLKTTGYERFWGWLDENGKLVCKSSLSLSILSKAMLEYNRSK